MATQVSSTFDPTTGKPPRPRRSIPVSLRIFVAILVMLSAGAAAVGLHAYWQYNAIGKIESTGGSVGVAHWAPVWMRQWIGDDRVNRLFGDVVFVNMGSQAHTTHHMDG